MTREVIREYAEANGVRLRENEFALFLDVPKGHLVFKLMVLKGNEVLEWFINVNEAASGTEIYSTNFEHYAINDESHEELAQELEETVVAFLRALQTADVRVAQEPLFRIFGKAFGTHERLEFKADDGWRDWASFHPPSSAQPRVAGRHRA